MIDLRSSQSLHSLFRFMKPHDASDVYASALLVAPDLLYVAHFMPKYVLIVPTSF